MSQPSEKIDTAKTDEAGSYSVESTNHLGLVAAMVDELGLVECIDQMKQVVTRFICENQAGIPVFMKSLSGNSNDQTDFRATIKTHIEGLKEPDGALCGRFRGAVRTAEQARAALSEIENWVNGNGLTLHPEKTHVGDCRIKGQGFEYPGYRFEAEKRWVRKKSLHKLKERIREKTRRTRGDSLERIIKDLNPMLKGWFQYFKHAHHRTFDSLDAFIRRRLRALLRRQEGRPGFGRTHEDSKRWPNACFANAGLFALYPAWRAESHP